MFSETQMINRALRPSIEPISLVESLNVLCPYGWSSGSTTTRLRPPYSGHESKWYK